VASPFDLRRFAPPAETTFTLARSGDHVYAVAGDVELDDVATMLRIENVVRGREDGDPAEALVEGKALLLRLIKECQPDVDDIRIGAQELIVVFALIVHGPSVAEAVMESITAANAADQADVERGDDVDRDDVERGVGGDATPLRSEKPSSGPSSSSDEREAGLLATGTA